jgi:hypothetical protein
MSKEDLPTEKIRQWIDEELDPKVDGQSTPRDWIREAAKMSIHDSKRPLGNSEWAYNLAVTMVPAFPEIVLDVKEYNDNDIEFTFDWEKFDAILNGTIDALINEDMDFSMSKPEVKCSTCGAKPYGPRCPTKCDEYH